MPLPALADWTNTRIGLHRAAQVIGAVRASVAEPQPNYIHLGLRIMPEGLTTGTLPGLGEFILDFHALAILYLPPEKETVGFSLVRHNQMSLTNAIDTALTTLGHPIKFNRDKITDEKVFEIDARQSAAYAQVLSLMAGALERFRASLRGQTTPVVVWPHGFDVSFLWFATGQASESAPHMSFGFSPSSDGFERPYVYIYAYPIPAGLTTLDLPSPAYWHTGKWTGAVLPYDELAPMDGPETVIEHCLSQIHAAVVPLL